MKDGTVENIDVLFERLEKNEVNMAAITDHDAFDYGVYDALRHKVDGARHLRKVLPGVEFTVSFKTNEGSKSVHVVTLFDDKDQESVRRISNAIPSKNGRPDYDNGCAFTEDAYWNIIREIGLDIVAIAPTALERIYTTSSCSWSTLKPTSTRIAETSSLIKTMPTLMISKSNYAL